MTIFELRHFRLQQKKDALAGNNRGAAVMELALVLILVVIVGLPVLFSVIIPNFGKMAQEERINAGLDAFSASPMTLQTLGSEGFLEDPDATLGLPVLIPERVAALEAVSGISGYCDVVLYFDPLTQNAQTIEDMIHLHSAYSSTGPSNCAQSVSDLPAGAVSAFGASLDKSALQTGRQFGTVAFKPGSLAFSVHRGLSDSSNNL